MDYVDSKILYREIHNVVIRMMCLNEYVFRGYK